MRHICFGGCFGPLQNMFLHLCISHSLLSVNSDPLSPSPHLYNCQMKLVEFLLDIFLVDKANGSLAYNILIQLRLMASVSCVPLSLSLSLSHLLSLSAVCLSLLSSRLSSLASCHFLCLQCDKCQMGPPARSWLGKLLENSWHLSLLLITHILYV